MTSHKRVVLIAQKYLLQYKVNTTTVES